MSDSTKYIPYFLRSLKHGVVPAGWKPSESSTRIKSAFLDVSKEPSMKKRVPTGGNKNASHIDMAKAFNILEGDLVQVLFGRDAGNSGVVRRILRSSNQVIVSGCNVIKSVRPSDVERQINGSLPGLVPVEAPIHVTNVVPLDPVVKKPTRIKRRYSMNGECVRISKVSGSAMPDPVSLPPTMGDDVVRMKLNLRSGFLRGSPLSSKTLNSWSKDQTHFRQLVARTNK